MQNFYIYKNGTEAFYRNFLDYVSINVYIMNVKIADIMKGKVNRVYGGNPVSFPCYH